MMEGVALVKQRDTRDELGLGSIRETFADLLFPGTSTLQTRARYFLFIPWLYRVYEQQRVGTNRVVDRLKRDEIRLIEALEAAGESEGVIGGVAGASLQRFPSSIYWNGLRTWAILRYSGSQGHYHRWLDRFYQREDNLQWTEVQPESVAGWGDGNWDTSLPELPDDFPEQADFRVRPQEAVYLRERLLFSCHDCLLRVLLDRCDAVADGAFVWAHPQLAEFPLQHREWINHARNFSEIMHGAVLLYNLMLAEKSEHSAWTMRYREDLESWRQRLEARAGTLIAWDRRAFWALVRERGRIPPLTRRFVDQWIDIVVGQSGVVDVASSEDARFTVRDQEVWLKRGRSRFENPRHLEMWRGQSGTGQMDYRWPIARRITNDILRGLGAT